MGNMSYCRFENTATDLGDCFDAVESGQFIDPETTSDYEINGITELLDLCKRFIQYEDEIEDAIIKWQEKQKELYGREN